MRAGLLAQFTEEERHVIVEYVLPLMKLQRLLA